MSFVHTRGKFPGMSGECWYFQGGSGDAFSGIVKHEMSKEDTLADSINKADLVAAIAADSGQSQAAVAGVVDSLFAVLAKSLADGKKVSIPGWIAVETTKRAARTGRNPATGETIQIAASTGVKISAGSKLKAAVK